MALPGAKDHTRALIASLFTAPPGSPTPHPESHVAHVQTFEGQEGTPSRKARFLVISALRDGRLKLHKAKENTNGTFSIGKTWGLDELRQVEVARRTVNTPSGPQSQPLEFTLGMNGKQYRYETEMPSAQQAAFLVRMVRCWRTYMAGRGQPDLILVGFNVDNQNGVRPSTAPAGTAPPGAMGARQAPPPNPSLSNTPYAIPQPTSSSSTRENFPSNTNGMSTRSDYSTANGNGNGNGARSGGALSSSSSSSSPAGTRSAGSGSISPVPDRVVRPSTATSTRTTTSTYRRTPSPPPSSGVFSGRRPSTANALPSSSTRAVSPGPSVQPPSRVISPPLPRPQSSGGISSRNGSNGSVRPPSTASSRTGTHRESSASFNTLYDQDPRGPAPPGAPQSRNGSTSAGPPTGSRSGSVAREGVAPDTGRSKSATGTRAPPTASSQPRRPSSPPPAPAASGKTGSTTKVLSPQPRKPNVDPEYLLDDDTVLTNVEEMLEGFEWRGGALSGGYPDRTRRGKADEIEKRLVGELKALEAASIHAIIESDDGVNFVIKHLDDALAELDKMDGLIGMYKSHLNLMADDIAHIESQNRGLQVQTSNQRMLLSELDNLMETIHIPESDLTALVQESLENSKGIERLEKAAISLYKALLSTRDTSVGDMAAASERVGEYRTKASQFCKRIFDFLAIMFKYQVEQTANPKDTSAKTPGKLPSHASMEEYLERYCGLMLFVKEIDYTRYQQICAAYFMAISDLHRTEIQGLMSTLKSQIRKVTEDEQEASFSGPKESPTIRQQSMRRVGTVVRSPHESGRSKDQSGKITGGEAFKQALLQVTPRITREQGFISDFLAINPLDASITFADYMQLETYFRRGATTYLASQQGKLKDIKSAMDLVFGFLEAEVRDWAETIVRTDNIQIVGILDAMDRAILIAQKERNEFLLRVFQKQYQKSAAALERSCKEQMKSIEATKVTLKKRKGVVPFVRVFPLFVMRVESQLDEADKLNIRQIIDANYERIVATIFDSLQQLAKMDVEGGGGAEDKDQLNYHVIIIENMHHIVTVFSKQRVHALDDFVSQARDKYHENLDSYIKLVLRRPLARLLDFFHGLEQLLRTTPPTEVSLHGAYTKGALRRTISDLRAKDLRKAIDVLYKRVDKHFGDVLNPSAEHTAVIKEVWKACEDEVQRLTSAWKSLIEKCYPDEKSGIEFSRDDVREFFAKAQV